MTSGFPRLRPRLLVVLSLCIGSCGVLPQPALAQGAAGDAITPYAPVKRPSRAITRRDTLRFLLPGPYPERGVLVSNGSFLSPGARWTIIDLDAPAIVRLRTTTRTLPDGRREAVIDSKAGRSLTAGEVNAVIEQANAVWNPPPIPPAPPRMLTDVTCDVVLFDREDVLHDFGFACPSERFVAAIEALAVPAEATR